MARCRTLIPTVAAVLVMLTVLGCQSTPPQARSQQAPTIVINKGASLPEALAAREIRRYIYLRTGLLAPIERRVDTLPSGRPLIVVAYNNRPVLREIKRADPDAAAAVNNLGAGQYLLRTVDFKASQSLIVTGIDQTATLYAAYRFAEHLGVRFYLHGDTIPDEQIAWSMPDLDEKASPLFDIRGIQPFHDFPEGPDWWNLDDYKSVLAQLPKLRMNFFGLHTYPQGSVGPEPTVWIGLAEDVESDGSVKFSSPSSYQNTLRGNWGYKATRTSDFTFGADRFFERDDYGPQVMDGAMPWPRTLEERNAVFNRTAEMLDCAFSFARSLGIKTCVGTETPMIVPDVVKKRLEEKGLDPKDPAVVGKLYEGMFERIARAYPLDYYWFWTPEGWTWSQVKPEQVEATVADLKAAITAAEKVDAPFTLATCGWVLGPPTDRALFDNILPREMPISCINRNVGFEPVEPGFLGAKGRPKWAIPWLEDDPALTIPQLWVGRMRRDAADALAYGCTGLLGIHWRTRILGPNVSALANAAWNQRNWNPDFGRPPQPEPPEPRIPGRKGGRVATFPNNTITDTNEPTLYQSVLYDIDAYRIAAPNGSYRVTLKFCEPHYTEAGKRQFSVSLEGDKVIDNLDIFARVGQNKALDYTFDDVNVADDLLDIDFTKITEFPSIAAIVVEGPAAVRINCGGGAWQDYSADLPEIPVDTRPRDMSSDDFYADWARAQFGPQAAREIAAIFTGLDGGPLAMVGMPQVANLPRPATWVSGPGGIRPDKRPWSPIQAEYAFVEELAALRPLIKGPANLERFDYWLDNFRYMRAMGKVNYTWALFNSALANAKAEKDPDVRRQLAAGAALSMRRRLIADVADAQRCLFATVNTYGSLGNVANWQQHLFPTLLEEPGKELAELIGEPLPADAQPPTEYTGPDKIIVPTVRTSLCVKECLKLKIILPAGDSPRTPTLYWRPLGATEFTAVTAEHVDRGVYSVKIPADKIAAADFEYYIEAPAVDEGTLVFPPSAPRINQTVVIMARN